MNVQIFKNLKIGIKLEKKIFSLVWFGVGWVGSQAIRARARPRLKQKNAKLKLSQPLGLRQKKRSKPQG